MKCRRRVTQRCQDNDQCRKPPSKQKNCKNKNVTNVKVYSAIPLAAVLKKTLSRH